MWQSYNDVEIPNDGTATRFSLSDLVGTGPWAAGQSRVVMAGRHAAVLHVSKLAHDRGALVEERQEAQRSTAAAVQDSEQVRAHNPERMFPAKPDTPLIEPVRLTT